MENTHLSRKVDRAMLDIDSVIDEMISYIEELESDLDLKKDRIKELEDEIDELKNS